MQTPDAAPAFEVRPKDANGYTLREAWMDRGQRSTLTAEVNRYGTVVLMSVGGDATSFIRLTRAEALALAAELVACAELLPAPVQEVV